MNRSVGKEVKFWARLFFVLDILFVTAGVIILIAVVATMGNESYTILAFLGGIILLCLGILIARVKAVMLYAYGEMVDSTISINRKLNQM